MVNTVLSTQLRAIKNNLIIEKITKCFYIFR